MRELHLPSWAKVKRKGRVEMQADQFYPEILGELGVKEEQLTRYWLETARQIAKRDVQIALSGTKMQATSGGALVLLIKDGTKDADGVSRYAQSRHPDDGGDKTARADLKENYAKLRGVSI